MSDKPKPSETLTDDELFDQWLNNVDQQRHWYTCHATDNDKLHAAFDFGVAISAARLRAAREDLQAQRDGLKAALEIECAAREKAESDFHLWRNLAGATEGKRVGDMEALQRVLKEKDRRISAALAYVETHMDEDITNNGQANDGMSLRMILEGRDG